MPIMVKQKFPRCTLCGKMLPLKLKPISIGAHRLCSERCVELLYRLRPDEVPKEEFEARQGSHGLLDEV